MDTIRVDLHVHSDASWDATLTAEELGEACRRRGVKAVAITDHNKFGAHEEIARKCPDLAVIPGEEITTRDGEIIGLFLRELVPRGLSAAETIERVKGQGGLVHLPHPYVPLAFERVRPAVARSLMSAIDIVETWNARNPTGGPDRRARELCDREAKAPGAGSDRHSRAEAGRGTIEMEPFGGADDFLAKLRGGRVAGERSHPWALLRGCAVMLAHLARGGRWGG